MWTCSASARAGGDLGEEADEEGADGLQFLMVSGGKAGEFVAAAGGELHEDAAAVVGGGGALDELPGLQAVDEADGAVVGDAEALGEFADGDPVAAGVALDGEEGEVLLHLQAVLLGGLFAEGEEFAEFVPEGCQGLVVALFHGNAS